MLQVVDLQVLSKYRALACKALCVEIEFVTPSKSTYLEPSPLGTKE
jgi:hypothetical protein